MYRSIQPPCSFFPFASALNTTPPNPTNPNLFNRRVPLLLRRQSFAARHYPALAVQTLLDSEGRRVAYIRLRRFDAQVRNGYLNSKRGRGGLPPYTYLHHHTPLIKYFLPNVTSPHPATKQGHRPAPLRPLRRRARRSLCIRIGPAQQHGRHLPGESEDGRVVSARPQGTCVCCF